MISGEIKRPFLDARPSFMDERGLLHVIYDQGDKYSVKNIKITKSKYGVLRGFHGQIGRYQEHKIITLISGKIQDVCLEYGSDLKPTGQIFESILDASNAPVRLHIPRGWLHAYLTLSEESVVAYLCDNIYGNEIVLNPLKHYDFWNLPKDSITISSKDINGN